MAITFLLMIYQVKHGTDISLIIGSYFFYLCIVYILRLFNCYAGGDCEIFIAIGYFIGSLNKGFPLTNMLLNILIASIIVVILNFKYFNVRKLEFNSDKTIAFAPAIAISTILLIVF